MPNHDLPFIPGAPDPDKRQRMINDAFKDHPLKASFIKKTQPTNAEDQAVLKLEHDTQRIFNQCVEVIKLDATQNGTWDKKAAHLMAMNLWKDALAPSSKNELHFLLSMVLSSMILEKLDDVDTTPR